MNKNCSNHPFHKLSVLGYHYESKLKPVIQKQIGETITKTTLQTDTMDFESESTFAELKSRSDQYHYSQWFIKRDGWLLPTCKINRAKEELKKGKKVIFFYFWVADKSLWRLDFTEEGCLDMNHKYPEWHHDQQQQTYIKDHYWKRIN